MHLQILSLMYVSSDSDTCKIKSNHGLLNKTKKGNADISWKIIDKFFLKPKKVLVCKFRTCIVTFSKMGTIS